MNATTIQKPSGAVIEHLLRYDHRGRMVPVDIPINEIEYIWIRDREKNRDELNWLSEFEELLRSGKEPSHSFWNDANHRALWESIKVIHQSMVAAMKGKESANIIDGMRDPFLVRWWQQETKWLPLKGNQRLCVLRSKRYKGNVPCRIR